MKRLVLSVIMVVTLFVGVHAEGILDNLTICTLYDFNSKDLLSGGFTDVISYKEAVAINLGIVTSIGTTVPFVGLDINVQKVAKGFGLEYHLKDPLKIGGFYSRDFSKATDIYGIFFGFTWE